MAKVSFSTGEFEALIDKSVRSAVYSALEHQKYQKIDQAEWNNLRQINALYSRQLDAIRTIAKYSMTCACDKYAKSRDDQSIKCKKCRILGILAREQ